MSANPRYTSLNAAQKAANKRSIPRSDAQKMHACSYCQTAVREWGIHLGKLGWFVKEYGYNHVREAIVEVSRRQDVRAKGAYLRVALENGRYGCLGGE